jgi:Flp pilus assembly protein TadD
MRNMSSARYFWTAARPPITHFETAANLSPKTDYMHYQLQAAYRKEGRTADADHELNIYKQLKAGSNERCSGDEGTP